MDLYPFLLLDFRSGINAQANSNNVRHEPDSEMEEQHRIFHGQDTRKIKQ